MAVGRVVCPDCGNIVLRLSWSALREHEVCKERGFQQRAGKRAKAQDQRVFFPGTVTDRVVRDWLVEDPSPGLMPDMVESVIEREWKTILDEGGSIAWKNASDKKQVLADCREAVTKIEPALMKFVVPFEYQADYRFRLPYNVPHPAGGHEKILLIGAMDIRVRDDKDRWWIWDVKHTRDDSYWRKTEGQLTFYDVANLLEVGKGTVRVGLLQPLCKEQVKPFEITDEKRTQMQARISAFARDIWTGERTPRQDTKECGWCSVRHACSKFQPVLAADGKRRMELF